MRHSGFSLFDSGLLGLMHRGSRCVGMFSFKSGAVTEIAPHKTAIYLLELSQCVQIHLLSLISAKEKKKKTRTNVHWNRFEVTIQIKQVLKITKYLQYWHIYKRIFERKLTGTNWTIVSFKVSRQLQNSKQIQPKWTFWESIVCILLNVASLHYTFEQLWSSINRSTAL